MGRGVRRGQWVGVRRKSAESLFQHHQPLFVPSINLWTLVLIVCLSSSFSKTEMYFWFSPELEVAALWLTFTGQLPYDSVRVRVMMQLSVQTTLFEHDAST